MTDKEDLKRTEFLSFDEERELSKIASNHNHSVNFRNPHLVEIVKMFGDQEDSRLRIEKNVGIRGYWRYWTSKNETEQEEPISIKEGEDKWKEVKEVLKKGDKLVKDE